MVEFDFAAVCWILYSPLSSFDSKEFLREFVMFSGRKIDRFIFLLKFLTKSFIPKTMLKTSLFIITIGTLVF